jgi:hypothetical protein
VLALSRVALYVCARRRRQSGTLVNAVLHHCSLPAMRVASGSRPRAALFPDDDAGAAAGSEEEEEDELEDGDEDGGEGGQMLLAPSSSGAAVLRPGIVHRLDKGCVHCRQAALPSCARTCFVACCMR